MKPRLRGTWGKIKASLTQGRVRAKDFAAGVLEMPFFGTLMTNERTAQTGGGTKVQTLLPEVKH